MRGHIVQRSEGSYSLVLELGEHPETGKRQQKWITFRGTKKAAENELNRRLKEIQDGNFVNPDKVTVSEFFDQWLALVQPDLANKTYDRYKGMVEHHIKPVFGQLRLQRLTPYHVEMNYSRLKTGGRKDGRAGGLSAQTLLHLHRLLREALQKAVSWNILTSNPIDRVTAPRVKAQELTPIDETQAAWLLTVAEGTRLHIPIMLAICCGIRRGEILAARWSDLDTTRATLRIVRSLEESTGGIAFKEPKSTKGRREVALPTVALESLKAHREAQQHHRELLGDGYGKEDLICCVEDGSIWKPSAFTSAYRDLLRRRKLSGPNFHALRHAHASWLIKSGVDVKTVSTRLGHARTSFTMDRYVHAMPGQDEEAAKRTDAGLRKALEAGIASRKAN